ncbi:cell surface protein [Lactiplantibacillus modestisalitolerans]|uniref:Cell surface protein n=1 Tax=Lactiplantibacillus modestisalitolerans TaxID=1457219 RepID=A0ABV5WS95_9LACO|nr:cell surface protein [Lactiplantibacillus modestisalitolerans]
MILSNLLVNLTGSHSLHLVSGDVQSGTYQLLIQPAPANAPTGPLANWLPQMNAVQQWGLVLVGLIGLTLTLGLITIWWRNRQRIKEQPQ